MALICPVSDLRNYNSVLEQVSAGSPVYLTDSGRARYTIRDIADDEEFEKTKAMLRLMCEFNTGICSGRVILSRVFSHFQRRINKLCIHNLDHNYYVSESAL